MADKDDKMDALRRNTFSKDLHAKKNTFLELSCNILGKYFPQWRATVDCKDCEISKIQNYRSLYTRKDAITYQRRLQF